MRLNDSLASFLGTQDALTSPEIVGALFLSFLLAMVFAVVYQITFRGFSYSRSYIHTMVIGSMVTCMLIMAVGTNLARGMGILGTLAIIRFRTPVRDPRDAMFLFACLGVGIACGSGMAIVAIIGTVMINVVALILHWAPFASRRDYEGLLRFSIQTMSREGTDPERDKRCNNAKQIVKDILIKHCDSFYILGKRDAEQGKREEFSYQVRLIDPSHQQDIITELSQHPELFDDTVLMMQRATVEL